MNSEKHARELTAALQSSAYHRWLDAYRVRVQESSAESSVPYRADFEGEDEQIHPAVISAVAHVALTSLLQLIGAQARTPGGLMVEQLGRAPAGNGLFACAQIVRGVAHVEVRTSDGQARVARATLVVPTDAAPATPTSAVAHEPQLVYPV